MWPSVCCGKPPRAADSADIVVDNICNLRIASVKFAVGSDELVGVTCKEVYLLKALERLGKEKEYVGIFLSSHPLDQYRVPIQYACLNVSEIEQMKKNRDCRTFTVAGIVTGCREGMTKKSTPYGILTLQDYTGSYEFALFGNDYTAYRNFLKENLFIAIIVKTQERGSDWKYPSKNADNTPKEMIRCNMTEKTLNSIALLSVIMNNDITTQEIFFDDEFIERDENGNYIVTLPEWYTLSSTSEEFISHGFSGLMRSPEIKDCLHDLTLTQPNGNVVYTFDKEYNLTSMVFDIIMPEEGSYDLHGEIIFDKWNEVPIINVPRVTELEHTTTAPVTDVPVEETEITE